MLVLNNITFEFGSRCLYRDTSWHIRPGEKIGLIGANGTGKSTLLRIIDGEYSITSGEITKRRDLTIGFLNQDLLSYDSDKSILEVAMEAFTEENRLAAEIETLLVKLETDQSEDILHRLHDAQTQFATLDGYSIESKASSILEGLGFATDTLTKPLNQFSGGWRMRVMLAKILLQQPGLLLLDEPTNHLDLPSIQWLESYLDNYEGTVVIVSHDRYFLDRVVNRIAEISDCKITIYKGDYSYYLEAKAEAEMLQRARFQNQQDYIKQQEKFIDRFRAKATKARAVQSRIKSLERLEKFNDVNDPSATIQVKFSFSSPPGRVLTNLHIRSKRYKDLTVFENAEVTIERGDKIALIGANGRGKSTLLRMIDGSEPFEGKTLPGHNVVKAFYAQHQLESLNLANDLLEELRQAAPEQNDTTLRTLLGAFLFKGDDVFKKIKVLSGGEKSRVALAKTMLTKANFLLLDEPTNHLDIQSVNVLIQVLRSFDGSYVIVSHDRFFLAEVANKIWYIENQKLKEYPGTYAEYEDWVERKKATEQSEKVAEVKKKEMQQPADTGLNRQAEKENKKQHQKLQQAVKKLEDRIVALKDEKAEIMNRMSDPEIYTKNGTGANLQERFQENEKILFQLQQEYDETFLKLLELEL
ncbi:MAG TPA: ABC-F family ATP-binding cassette domain-containing protein [Bacteroidia bacterium]|nr:ABC-F family ATP-binding cassette domain-containing protein [Bacteroidia bacterium]